MARRSIEFYNSASNIVSFTNKTWIQATAVHKLNIIDDVFVSWSQQRLLTNSEVRGAGSL